MHLNPPPKLTRKNALPVSLFFMMGADGDVDDEEIGQLRFVIGDDEALTKVAIAYMYANTHEYFLVESMQLLSPQQKPCVVLSITDSLMSDGDSDLAQQELLPQTLAAYRVSQTNSNRISDPFYLGTTSRSFKDLART